MHATTRAGPHVDLGVSRMLWEPSAKCPEMHTCELDKVSEVMAKEGCSFKKSWNVAGAEGSNEEHDETTKKPCNTTEMNARMATSAIKQKVCVAACTQVHRGAWEKVRVAKGASNADSSLFSLFKRARDELTDVSTDCLQFCFCKLVLIEANHPCDVWSSRC